MFNGVKIKELRKSRNLTQQQLGDLVHVTKVSICCYEKGTRTPNVDTLVDLANELDVSVDYLLNRDIDIVADNDESYSKRMPKEDIVFMDALKKNKKVYKNLLEDPKRYAELISKKMK